MRWTNFDPNTWIAAALRQDEHADNAETPSERALHTYYAMLYRQMARKLAK